LDFTARNVFADVLEIDANTASPFKELLMVDFANKAHTCITGSKYSHLNKYCNFMSHDHMSCIKYKMCTWVPNELSTTLTAFSAPDSRSCQPCTNFKQPDDLPTDVNDHTLSVVSSALKIGTSINKAGDYNVLTAMMQQGALGINIYENPDFTRLYNYTRMVCIVDDMDF
jgi:hypothetical protein